LFALAQQRGRRVAHIRRLAPNPWQAEENRGYPQAGRVLTYDD